MVALYPVSSSMRDKHASAVINASTRHTEQELVCVPVRINFIFSKPVKSWHLIILIAGHCRTYILGKL